MCQCLTQGSRPGLSRSAALAGLFQFQIPSPNPFPCTNISEPTNARRPQSNPTITLPTTDQAQIRLSLYIIWGWVSPLGRHSCKAQGGESAKGTNRTLGTHGQKNKSSVGAALSVRVFALFSCGSWLCIRWESIALAGLIVDKSKIKVSVLYLF